MRPTGYHAPLLLTSLALALSACGSPQPTATEAPEAAQTESATSAPAESAPTASAPTSAPAPAGTKAAVAKGDPIRGKGGLEERCLKEVARQGTTVIGTNRIEESQAAIEIYVNVAGGQAPWRCRGYRDGTIESVEYSGSEGDL